MFFGNRRHNNFNYSPLYKSEAYEMMSKCQKCKCMCKCCPPHEELPVCPKDPQLANSYVPFQYIEDIFDPMSALCSGTAFPELVRPYSKDQSQFVNMYLQQTKSPCEEGSPYGY
jgi:hypothetical protein